MRAVWVSILVVVAGCWPPLKVSGGAGGSFGGARVEDRTGVERVTDDVPATQLRVMAVVSAMNPAALDRRWDVAAGWEGEWLHTRDTSALLRQGFVFEVAWFPVVTTPAEGVRWRFGPTAELLAYEDGFGGMIGVAAEYAFDKWMVASKPDAGRGMIGGIIGEVSLGAFLRGGMRRKKEGDRDGLVLAGIELELPGFCFICGVSSGH